INTVTKFLAYAICYEQSAWTAIHYDQCSSRHTTGSCQPVKVGMFLAKHSEMEQNCNLWYVVWRTMPAEHKPGLGQAGNIPIARDAQYGPGLGQPAPKVMWDVPPRVGPPKVGFDGNDAGYKPSGGTPHCYNCGWTGHFSKACKVPRAQIRAAHTAAVESDAEAGQEEPANDNKEVPQDIEEQSAVDDAESIQINGDEYVAVDKAADKLQQPQYTPQEKECLVTYVEVNGCPAWALWDSGSTTTGIMPQFVHVNAIHIHKLTEPLMLQLGTAGSHAIVQFSAEVRVKTSGQPMKEYVDIANFDRYDMIIGMPFMRKNKVVLNFVNNRVIINRIPSRAERVVLADMDSHLQWNVTVEDGDERLAPMTSLLADALVIMMSEEEFQGTLERGDGPDRPRTVERKAAKKPDKACQPDKTRAE
ncbi:hypothetical protein C0992_006073, partial [Termitomyces sp. T32_za158]